MWKLHKVQIVPPCHACGSKRTGIILPVNGTDIQERTQQMQYLRHGSFVRFSKPGDGKYNRFCKDCGMKWYEPHPVYQRMSNAEFKQYISTMNISPADINRLDEQNVFESLQKPKRIPIKAELEDFLADMPLLIGPLVLPAKLVKTKSDNKPHGIFQTMIYNTIYVPTVGMIKDFLDFIPDAPRQEQQETSSSTALIMPGQDDADLSMFIDPQEEIEQYHNMNPAERLSVDVDEDSIYDFISAEDYHDLLAQTEADAQVLPAIETSEEDPRKIQCNFDAWDIEDDNSDCNDVK